MADESEAPVAESRIDDQVLGDPHALVEVDLGDQIGLADPGVERGDDLQDEAGDDAFLADVEALPVFTLPLNAAGDRDVRTWSRKLRAKPVLGVEENHHILGG